MLDWFFFWVSGCDSNERKFRSYVDKSPTGIFAADKNGCYVDVNDAVCKITGYSKDELIGMNLINLIDPKSRPGAGKSFEQVVKTGVCRMKLLFVQNQGNYTRGE